MRGGAIQSQTVSGLRTRYTPKSRIGHSFVSMAPWLDVVLVLVFLLLLENRLVVQPGVIIELPEAVFTGGISSDLIAVVLSVESGPRGRREQIILFDDERYMMNDEQQLERLQRVLRLRRRHSPESGLIVEADRLVPQGALITLFEMARRAGIRRVDVATQDPRQNMEKGQ